MRHLRFSHLEEVPLPTTPFKLETSTGCGISLDNTLQVSKIESVEIRNGNMPDKPRRTGTVLFVRNYDPYDEIGPFSPLQQVKELDSTL